MSQSQAGGEESQHDASADNLCGICFTEMDLFDNPRGVLNSCDHKFCAFCIASWAQSSNHCPHCKQRFTRIHTTVLRDTIPQDETKEYNTRIIDGKKYFETVEEKKVRRRNYRYEESDDSEEEDEDEEEEEVRRLLAETDPTQNNNNNTTSNATSNTTTRRRRTDNSAAAGPSSTGNSNGTRARFAVDETEFEAEEADWFERLLAGPNSDDALLAGDAGDLRTEPASSSCAAAPVPSSSFPSPAAPLAAQPPTRRSGGATSTVQERGSRRGNRRRAAAVIVCSVCKEPIGTEASVACDKRRCTYIAHNRCVGLREEEERGNDDLATSSISLTHGNMVGEKYFCPAHPHQPAAPPRRARGPRATRQIEDEDAEEMAPPQQLPQIPPPPPVEPLEFGGGAGFAKLPDLPGGTLGTGEAMLNSLPTLGTVNNLDVLNSQRTLGMEELAKRQAYLNLNRGSANMPLARSGGRSNNNTSSRSNQSTSNVGSAVLTVDQTSLSNKYSATSVPGVAAPDHQLQKLTTNGSSRGVGKKSQRNQQEKKPLPEAPATTSTTTTGGSSSVTVASLEAIEAQVYADELANLRDLQYHARKAQGLEMGFKQDMWDSMGEMKLIPTETSTETTEFLSKQRKEAELLDDRLKARARAAAKAYVEKVVKARKDHETVVEARRRAREQTALLKLQMLIANRRREFAELQQKQRQNRVPAPNATPQQRK